MNSNSQQAFNCIRTYGTSHKKVSRVTQYVTLLNDCLFSTYNSITCVLRLMLSGQTAYIVGSVVYSLLEYNLPLDVFQSSTESHTHVRKTELTQATSHVLCVLYAVPYPYLVVRMCMYREKEEELRLSTRYSDSRGMGL